MVFGSGKLNYHKWRAIFTAQVSYFLHYQGFSEATYFEMKYGMDLGLCGCELQEEERKANFVMHINMRLQHRFIVASIRVPLAIH